MDDASGPRPRPEPQPAQDPNGPPLVGWAVSASGARGASSRLTAITAWVGALVISSVGTWLRMGWAGGTDGYRVGYVLGAVLGPFLISAVLRLVVVGIRERGFRLGALTSLWVPLGAVIIVFLSALGAATR